MPLHDTEGRTPDVASWPDICATLQQTLAVFEQVSDFVASSPWRDRAAQFESRRIEGVARLARARLASGGGVAARVQRPSASEITAQQDQHATVGVSAADAPLSAAADPDPRPTPKQPRPSASESPLSAREREVAVLIARGLSNRAIADELVVVPGTVANHVANILRKLDCTNRAQVAAWAVRHGLVADDSLA